MNILVTNVYSYKNKGDAAIVIAQISEIKRVFPKASIAIQSIDIKHDKNKYGVPVSGSLMWILLSSVRDDSLPKQIYKLVSRVSGLLSYLLFYRLLHLRIDWLLSNELKKFVSDIESADLVITCGGGYLRTTETSPRILVWLYVVCLNFLTGYYLGKPIYMYSQSIGPLNDWISKSIVRFSLNRTSLIEVREDISFNYVKKLKIKAPVVRTSDPVFLLKGQKMPSPIKLDEANLKVGVTVRNWFNNKTQLDNYLNVVARLIDYLIKNYDAQVIYIPQVIATEFGDDDRVVAKMLQQKVKHKDKFRLVLEDYHPFELMKLCSEMDIFIGTRMHSNIFALINNVPVVAIQYEHKTKGIMDRLGLSEATIDIEKLTFELLKQKTEHVLNNRDSFKKLIELNMVKQIKLSRSAMEIIKQDYEKGLV